MKITLSLWDDGTNKTKEIQVDAYKLDDSALAIHKSTWIYKDEVIQGKRWNITHIPSGMIIFSGFTKRAYAVETGNKLSLLADWSTITPENCRAWYDKNKEAMLELKRNIC